MNLSDVWTDIFKSTKGRFFTCTFRKKNGSLRTLNGKVGHEMKIDSTGHLVVLDVKANFFIDSHVYPSLTIPLPGWRKIDLRSISSFRCGSVRIGNNS